MSTVGIRESSLVIFDASISVKGTRELHGFQEKSMGDTNISRRGVDGRDTLQSCVHAEENDWRSSSNIDDDRPHQHAMHRCLSTASSRSGVTEGKAPTTCHNDSVRMREYQI